MREVKHSIENIKRGIEMIKGQEVMIRVNTGRNKIIDYNGKVQDLYACIFTIRPMDNTMALQTYSYSEVITGNIKFRKLSQAK